MVKIDKKLDLHQVIKFKNVVFYDGSCGLCSASVQFILKNRKKQLYFIELQSSLAETILSEYNVKIKLDTIYYLENKKLYDYSSAALHIAKNLKGIYPAFFYIGIIFPRFFRNGVYSFVSKIRNKIYPKHCILPTEEEKSYFLK